MPSGVPIAMNPNVEEAYSMRMILFNGGSS
jgi:hypothetical protein